MDGNEILIRAVLSVWKVLEEPIVKTTSADQVMKSDIFQILSLGSNSDFGVKFQIEGSILGSNFFLSRIRN